MKNYFRLFGLILTLGLLAIPSAVFGQATYYVDTYAKLVEAITTYNSGQSDCIVTITGEIKLTGDLPVITGNSGTTLTISGLTNAAINGDDKYRGFVIDTAQVSGTGTVSISSLTFTQCTAQGGDGGSGLSGGGGGMGAGGAIYAKSGNITLVDVYFTENSAIGGAGGDVISQSKTYGGGGGLATDGQGGTIGDALTRPNGTGGKGGGYLKETMVASTGTAGDGGGITYTADGARNQKAHTHNGQTGLYGGDGGYGGGGGGSTFRGGEGGLGGGGGAGSESGGQGGFGGGGGGSLSANTSGLGGFGAGNGGYQTDIPASNPKFGATAGGGTGGGGAALGGAVYIEEGANLSITYNTSATISGNTVTGGNAGSIYGTNGEYSGGAQDGEGIGSGFFLKDDLTLDITDNVVITIKDSLGGYAGATKNTLDINKGGLIKNGEGTLVLQGKSTYTGDTVINDGILVAKAQGALSQYSALALNDGKLFLEANQSVENIYSDPIVDGENSPIIDLNGYSLTFNKGGLESDDTYGQTYYGQILSKGSNGIGGLLVMDGIGELRLAGDSRGSALWESIAPDNSEFTNLFTTLIKKGTIVAENEGAFGDGMITYGRTDSTDLSKAIAFGTGLNGGTLANTVVMYNNSVPLRIGTSSDNDATDARVMLTGRVYANPAQGTTPAANGVLMIDNTKASQTVVLANTGVSDGKYNSGNANSFSQLFLERGTVEVVVDKVVGASNGNTTWYTSLNNAMLTNNRTGNRLVIAGGDTADSSDYLAFDSSVNLLQGLLTISNAQAGQELHFVKSSGSQTLSGLGGINVDLVDADDVLYMVGTTLSYSGETRITNGILDISGANTNQTATLQLGAITTAGSGGTLVVGNRNLAVNVNLNGSYGQFQGVITDSIDSPSATGITINKTGSDDWGLSLLDGSNVSKINVSAGALVLIDESLQNLAITLTGSGGVAAIGARTLDNLDAKTAGTFIRVLNATDSLYLTDENTVATIRATLLGKGTIQLGSLLDIESKPIAWTISGDNKDWNGTIVLDENASMQTTSANALTTKSTVELGNNAKLGIGESTSLGVLSLMNVGTVEILDGKTLSLGKLGEDETGLSSLVVTGVTKQGSLLGTGKLTLAQGAAIDFAGDTTITNAVVYVAGDNRYVTEDDDSRGITRLEGGTLALDYTALDVKGTGLPYEYNSLWGDEAIEVGTTQMSTIKVIGKGHHVNLLNDINFDNTLLDGQELFPVPWLEWNADLDSFTWSGIISGEGNLYKSGNGLMIVAGSLDATGSIDKVEVAAGTMQLGVNGVANDIFAQSEMSVKKGATLTGWTDSLENLFAFGTVALKQYDNLALGAATGTNALSLYADGKLTFNVKDADEYTTITAENGNINLYGGTIHLVVDDAFKSQITGGMVFDIIEATNGTFYKDASKLLLTNNVAAKRSQAVYTDSGMGIQLVDANYYAEALSVQAGDVGRYLNQMVDLNTMTANQMLNAVDSAWIQNNRIYNDISGEMTLSSMATQINTQNQIRQIIGQTVLPQGTPTFTGLSRGQMGREGVLGTWAAFFGAGGSFKGDVAYRDLDYSLLGGIVGVDVGGGNSPQLGLFYSYADSKSDTQNNLGKVNISENIFGSYLKWNDPLGYGLVTGNFGWSQYKGERTVVLTDATNRYNSKHSGWMGNIYAERGVNWAFGRSSISPFLGLAYTHLVQNSFDENGVGDFALHYDSLAMNSLLSVLGIRMNRTFCLSRSSLDAFIYANWTHEYLDTRATGNASFVTLGNTIPSFAVNGIDVGADWGMFGVGARWDITDRFQCFGSGDLQSGTKANIVSGNAGMRYSW